MYKLNYITKFNESIDLENKVWEIYSREIIHGSSEASKSMREHFKKEIDRIMEIDLYPKQEMPLRAKDHLSPQKVLKLFTKVEK